jgi:hypothetical protein
MEIPSCLQMNNVKWPSAQTGQKGGNEYVQGQGNALDPLLGQEARLHAGRFVGQHGPVAVGRTLHDLAGKGAGQLVVEAAAHEQEVAARAQALDQSTGIGVWMSISVSTST